MAAAQDRVLVLTGPLIDGKERSLAAIRRKAGIQGSRRRMGWLNTKLKILLGELLLGFRLERRRLASHPPGVREAMARMEPSGASAPEPALAEVILAGALRECGLACEGLSLAELAADPEALEAALGRNGCVFLSATFLFDAAEVEGLARLLKRPHNRIVVGGALMGILHAEWEGMPEVDVVAVGYGEFLVPALAAWIRSGYAELEAPARGRLLRKAASAFLYSGTPETRDLDFLPRPDWTPYACAGSPLRRLECESVRGCPYRCSFCNYPFLFDDHVFRYKSAARMADDWEAYARDLGVETIACLDSLFTMPKPRLLEFCRLLIDRGVRVRWVCYARADDLADEEAVILMKRAGAAQVQIGIESGNDGILRAMNKRCSVESNRRALENCRKHGIATMVTVIVGHPGETRGTLEDTCRFLEETRPDFYFATLFTPRAPAIPILKSAARERFALRVVSNLHGTPPYWGHGTMDCTEVGDLARELDRRLIRGRVSLNAALFRDPMLRYEPGLRKPLLDFQARALGRPLLQGCFSLANRYVNRRLRRDYRQALAGTADTLEATR